MKLTTKEANLLKGYLQGKNLTLQEAAGLIDRHRATLQNYLAGRSDFPILDVLNLGAQIALHQVQQGKRA